VFVFGGYWLKFKLLKIYIYQSNLSFKTTDQWLKFKIPIDKCMFIPRCAKNVSAVYHTNID